MPLPPARRSAAASRRRSRCSDSSGEYRRRFPCAFDLGQSGSGMGTDNLHMADYPADLALEHRLADGRTVLIRPIRAGDEAEERRFFARLSDEAKSMRFMKSVGALSGRLIYSFTHVDYAARMAFVCE